MSVPLWTRQTPDLMLCRPLNAPARALNPRSKRMCANVGARHGIASCLHSVACTEHRQCFSQHKRARSLVFKDMSCLEIYMSARESLSFKVKQALDAESTAQHNSASPFCLYSSSVVHYVQGAGA